MTDAHKDLNKMFCVLKKSRLRKLFSVYYSFLLWKNRSRIVICDLYLFPNFPTFFKLVLLLILLILFDKNYAFF